MAQSNQLKFNLNAVVDNLNLVNLVHKPKPILIEKINTLTPDNSNYYGRNRAEQAGAFRNDVISTGSNFEFIDETKMSMYSYLVQRELKNKEWLSKFELDQADKTNIVSNKSNENKQPVATKTNIKKPAANSNKQIAFQTEESDSKSKLGSNNASRTSLITHNTSNKASNELNELKKCGDDTIKAIENLEKQLNECN